jgi:hypothetical protein
MVVAIRSAVIVTISIVMPPPPTASDRRDAGENEQHIAQTHGAPLRLQECTQDAVELPLDAVDV